MSGKQYVNKFVEENEKKGRLAFKQLNNDQNWFTNLTFSEDLSAQIDGIGTTEEGKKVYIEIKTRGGEYGDFFKFIKHFDTIFLDYGKLNAMSEALRKDKAQGIESGAIFVSVFNDGDVILIHNLKKPFYTKHLGLQQVTNFAKKEDGKDEKEYELKTGLSWEDASKYKKDGNGQYYRWEWDDIDRWDIMPLVKTDKEQLLNAFQQILYISRLDDSHPLKRELAWFIQSNDDTINDYLKVDLDKEMF